MATSPSNPVVLREEHGAPSPERTAERRLMRSLTRGQTLLQQADQVPTAFPVLVAELDAIRRSVSSDMWTERLAPRCREHPIAARLQADPYTQRAFRKPRGFPGDAELLDFVYDRRAPQGVSELGLALFGETTSSPSAQSVRDRRERLTTAIRRTADRRPGARIASIACGHLRELETLAPWELERIERMFAVDQDQDALARVAHHHPHERVQTTLGSVRGLIGRKLVLERLDLVYAAGLFDYLSDKVSALLLERMLSFLSPGGRLLIGNFTPENWGRAYMDSFMDWPLTYRSGADLRALGRIAAAHHDVAIERISVDDLGNIAYLELVRS